MDNGASSYLRFLKGDDSALAEIINEYSDGLIIYLNTITANYADAQDSAEDTFVKLVTKKPRYNCKATFKTWLYTIGRHVAVDNMRKKYRHHEIIGESTDTDYINLENEFIRDEDNRLLHKAIKSLSAEYRQVLYLTYFEGMTAGEVSAVIGKSSKATQSLIFRARQALKKQLERDGFEYENS